MKLLAPLLSTLVVAPLSAQTLQTTFVTPTGMSATASLGTRRDTKTLPKMHDLKGGAKLSAIMSSRAETTVGFSASSEMVHISIRESASSRYSSSSFRGYAATGSHVTELTIRPKSAIGGQVTIAWNVTAMRDGGSGTCTVDIGADGKNEFYATKTHKRVDLRVQVPTSGLKIRTTTSSRASSSSFYRSPFATASLAMTFRADPPSCDLRGYGRTCGPILNAIHTLKDEMELQLFHAPPRSPAILWIGTRQFDLRIPGSSCHIHTDAPIILGLSTDSSGRAAVPLPMGRKRPIRFRAQFATVKLQPLLLQTTNGLAVDCR